MGQYIPPVLTVSSGSTVQFSCLDASNGQLILTSTATSIAAIKLELCNQVNGPVYVQGAMPGDTFQIDVLDVRTADWGWTALIPGFGLLADEFPEPALKIWDLTHSENTIGGEVKRFAYLNKERGIRVPLRPFAGEMGVARGVPGACSTIPPYVTGGNLDTKYLTNVVFTGRGRGRVVFNWGWTCGAGRWGLVRGGLLIELAEQDLWDRLEEVCGTAIETPMDITVRLTVRKDKPYTKTPQFHTITPSANAEEYYCTTGIDADIREATRSAVRNMIAYLVAEHGLDRVDAYMLCSVAGDLKMHEVVDMPNYIVGMMIPKSVLGTM